jgi:hypothetical protein
VDGKHVVAYPQYRSSRYMWSVHDLDLGAWLISQQGSQGLTKLNTMTSSTCRRFPSLSYLALVGHCFTMKERCSYSFYFFEIKFSNNETSRIKFLLFYYISFHNNLSNMGSLLIRSQVVARLSGKVLCESILKSWLK